MTNFLHEYLSILSNPAHMLVEVTNTILIDVIFVGMLWPLFRRAIKKHDRKEHDHD